MIDRPSTRKKNKEKAIRCFTSNIRAKSNKTEHRPMEFLTAKAKKGRKIGV
jgi:hypothetical protein